MWIYPMDNGVIISEQGGTLPPNTGWYDSQIEMVSGVLKFSVWPETAVITSSASTPFNYWYYVGFTYDGVTQKAYVNGQLVGFANITRQTPYNNGGGIPFYFDIGGNCPTSLGDGGYGNFRLGTFEVYDGPLSSSQVLEIYNSTASTWTCVSPTPTPTITNTPTYTPSVTPT